MKIKIYPTIGSTYTVALPKNIQSEDDVNSWIEENLMLVEKWEEEKNWDICENRILKQNPRYPHPSAFHIPTNIFEQKKGW